jgi:putative transposase
MMQVQDMCLAFSVSRSGYYSWSKRPPSLRSRQDKVLLTPEIRTIFNDSRHTYGPVRIGDTLRDMGIMTSIRRIRRIMHQEKLVPRQIRRFRGITKRGADTSHIRDLVNRDFTAVAPNTVWVGDITEFMTLEGVIYLAFIIDLFSRYIVGWATLDNKNVRLVIDALVMAIQRRNPSKGFIFHSDHGSQYGAALFQSVLSFHGGVPSMGSIGDCYDNAVSESFVHTLKGECIHGTQLISREFTNRLLFDFIEVFYNRKRKHSTLGYMSPFEFEKAAKV